jgi:16S rRNA (adenine1518-N6/adenine1519-N6)-dimethyltransferase
MPSTKAYGPLSVIVQAFARVERIATLSPSCFWPKPEVTSAMVAVMASGQTPRRQGAGTSSNTDGRDFARFVTGLFTKRRKQLGGALGREHSELWSDLAAHGITPNLRPEALTPEQMMVLWQHVDRPTAPATF